MSEFSIPADFRIADDANLTDAVVNNAAEHPDLVVFDRKHGDSWQPITAKEFADDVKKVAAGLIASGVEAGDRVCIMSSTRYEWTLLDYAIWTAGGVTVPIYETSSAEQIKFVLGDSGAVLVFAETDAHADKIEQLKGELPELRKVFRIETSDTAALDELAETGKSTDRAELDARLSGIKSADPATLIYTSGTTGRPKGCQLTHANLVYEIKGAKASESPSNRTPRRLVTPA